MMLNQDATFLYKSLVGAADKLNKKEQHHRSLKSHITKVRKASLDKKTPKKEMEGHIRELRKKIDIVMEHEQQILKRSLEGDTAYQRFSQKLHDIEGKLDKLSSKKQPRPVIKTERPDVSELRQRMSQLRDRVEGLHAKVKAQPVIRIELPQRADEPPKILPRVRPPVMVNRPEPMAPPPAPPEPGIPARPLPVPKMPEDFPWKYPEERERIQPPIHQEIPPARMDPPAIPEFMRPAVKVPALPPEDKPSKKSEVHHEGKAPKLRPPGPMPFLEETEEHNKPIPTMRGTEEETKNPEKKGFFSRLFKK
ncbi:MAG: hypothetical protein KJ709_04875 [Nanoarchaeota archaeon]|nr:hypothetical protein [Nanoarchaeota archaeon]